jgi:hypothetical protein
MKIASVKHFWTKSPSADITKVVSVLNVNGAETVTEYGPDTESFTVDVNANSTVNFRIETYDGEGRKAVSETYTYTLRDLTDPMPATNLGHEVINIRDDGGEPAQPSAATRRQHKTA